MKVLIDGEIYLMAPSGGSFTYLNELLPRLSKRKDIQVELLLPKGVEASVPEVPTKKLLLPSFSWFPKGRLRVQLGILRRALEARILSFRVSKSQPPLFHSVYYGKPPLEDLPTIATIHDMITEKHPEFYDPKFAKPLTELKLQTIKRAQRLIAISEQTKRDIMEICGVEEDKIDVIPHGVNFETFNPSVKDGEVVERKRLLGKKTSYLLFVGGRMHHKNFSRLLDAYAKSQVKEEFPLVVAGADWQPEEWEEIKQRKLEDYLILVKHPSRRNLALLYRGASLFIYPSLYEGFGMPLLEAMACGTPVITSDVSVLREVAGEAALFFNPLDCDSIQKTILTALSPEQNQRLRKLGPQRAEVFTWERAAELTAEAYLKVSRKPVTVL